MGSMRQMIEPYDIRAWNEWHKMIRGMYKGRWEVCSTWRELFQNFVGDLGRPKKGERLNRRDKTLPYRKSNCYWS